MISRTQKSSQATRQEKPRYTSLLKKSVWLLLLSQALGVGHQLAATTTSLSPPAQACLEGCKKMPYLLKEAVFCFAGITYTKILPKGYNFFYMHVSPNGRTSLISRDGYCHNPITGETSVIKDLLNQEINDIKPLSDGLLLICQSAAFAVYDINKNELLCQKTFANKSIYKASLDSSSCLHVMFRDTKKVGDISLEHCLFSIKSKQCVRRYMINDQYIKPRIAAKMPNFKFTSTSNLTIHRLARNCFLGVVPSLEHTFKKYFIIYRLTKKGIKPLMDFVWGKESAYTCIGNHVLLYKLGTKAKSITILHIPKGQKQSLKLPTGEVLQSNLLSTGNNTIVFLTSRFIIAYDLIKSAMVSCKPHEHELNRIQPDYYYTLRSLSKRVVEIRLSFLIRKIPDKILGYYLTDENELITKMPYAGIIPNWFAPGSKDVHFVHSDYHENIFSKLYSSFRDMDGYYIRIYQGEKIKPSKKPTSKSDKLLELIFGKNYALETQHVASEKSPIPLSVPSLRLVTKKKIGNKPRGKKVSIQINHEQEYTQESMDILQVRYKVLESIKGLVQVLNSFNPYRKRSGRWISYSMEPKQRLINGVEECKNNMIEKSHKKAIWLSIASELQEEQKEALTLLWQLVKMPVAALDNLKIHRKHEGASQLKMVGINKTITFSYKTLGNLEQALASQEISIRTDIKPYVDRQEALDAYYDKYLVERAGW